MRWDGDRMEDGPFFQVFGWWVVGVSRGKVILGGNILWNMQASSPLKFAGQGHPPWDERHKRAKHMRKKRSGACRSRGRSDLPRGRAHCQAPPHRRYACSCTRPAPPSREHASRCPRRLAGERVQAPLRHLDVSVGKRKDQKNRATLLSTRCISGKGRKALRKGRKK